MTVYPTTPDTTIKAGDYVRSYDFPGEVSCFVEGVVECVEKSTDTYRIAISRRVIDNRETKSSMSYVWAPINGQAGIFGVLRGVVRVEEPAL